MSNNKLAQFYVAYCYANGFGLEQNLQLAVQDFTKLAQNNLPYAQFMLGCLSYLGKELKQDEQEAVNYFAQASNQGFALASLALAFMYSKSNDEAKTQQNLSLYLEQDKDNFDGVEFIVETHTLSLELQELFLCYMQAIISN